MKLDQSERVRLLADQAKTWYMTLTDHVFKHTAVQVVILGWALTGEGPRDRIEELDLPLRVVVLGLPIAYSLLVFAIFWQLRTHSKTVYDTMADLDEAALIEDLESYRIGLKFWFVMASVHTVLSVVIVSLLSG